MPARRARRATTPPTDRSDRDAVRLHRGHARLHRNHARLHRDHAPYRYVVATYPFGISCGILICHYQKDT
jgi:hypothetical protein